MESMPKQLAKAQRKLAAALADKFVQRTSLEEKIEAFKVKAAGLWKGRYRSAKGKEKTL